MDPIANQNLTPAPKKSAGKIIGIVIALLVIIVSALYFWGRDIETSDEVVAEDSAITASDDTSSIEADLTATDLSETDFSGTGDIE